MNRLLSLFMLTLAAHGLAPEGLDPWRGWVAFKEFARAENEVPDPGVSVQFNRETEAGQTRLVFLRQETRNVEGELTPLGAVVCEFIFLSTADRPAAADQWSFDYSSFDRFIDVVEQEPLFQDLIVTRPLRSAVYWEEA